jgi:hypothetical protein
MDPEVKDVMFSLALAHAEIMTGPPGPICEDAQKKFVAFIDKHGLREEFLGLCSDPH